MILSYKQKFPWGRPTNFEQKIKEGIKKHTIRDDIHGRWKPGMKIHHAYGVRTKNYDCFAEGVCTHIQIMEIREVKMGSSDDCYCFPLMSPKHHKNAVSGKIFRVIIDGKVLSETMIDLLAKNDGFNTTEDFFLWFNGNLKRRIIHWTDFKY